MLSDFIAPVSVAPSFTDVVANSGLNSNIPIIAFNIGTEQIRYTVSSASNDIKATLEFAEIPSSVATS